MTTSSAGRWGIELTQISPSSRLYISNAFPTFVAKMTGAGPGNGCSTVLNREKARNPNASGLSIQNRNKGRNTSNEVIATIASQTGNSRRAPFDCE